MKEDKDEILKYLKTTRDLETELMKLDESEKHAKWRILQLEGKGHPEFKPPNTNIE